MFTYFGGGVVGEIEQYTAPTLIGAPQPAPAVKQATMCGCVVKRDMSKLHLCLKNFTFSNREAQSDAHPLRKLFA